MAQRTCSRCASPAAVQCSRCKRAYCNPDCQRADWRAGHRLECAPPPEGARPASPVEEIESDSDDPVQALADLIVAARAGRSPIVGPRRWRRPRRLHSAQTGRSPIVGPRNPDTAHSFGSIRRIIIAVKSNS